MLQSCCLTEGMFSAFQAGRDTLTAFEAYEHQLVRTFWLPHERAEPKLVLCVAGLPEPPKACAQICSVFAGFPLWKPRLLRVDRVPFLSLDVRFPAHCLFSVISV